MAEEWLYDSSKNLYCAKSDLGPRCIGGECFYPSRTPLDGLLGLSFRVLGHGSTSCACISDRLNGFIVSEEVVVGNGYAEIAILYKRGITGHKALSIVSDLLNLPARCIKYLGVKDAAASTLQYIEVRCKPLHSRRYFVWRSGSKLLILYLPRKRGRLIHLGNSFTVVLKTMGSPSKLVERIAALSNRLLPNYYGYQRFGSRRPSSHVVAYLHVAGRYGLAVKEYIDSPYPDESPNNIAVRYNAFRALESLERIDGLYIGRGMRYEAWVARCVKGLKLAACSRKSVENPCIVLSAIQSWLFNKYLSLRIEEEYDPLTPLPGEKKGPSGVVAPVPGRGVRVREKARQLYQYIAESHGLALEAVESLTTCRLKGYWRSLFLRTSVKASTLSSNTVAVRFTLPRGSYATVLLREIACSPLCIT